MQGSALQGARLIFRREVACAMRSRSSWAAMFMFSLTAIAALSFALRCAPPEPQVAAGLLWVVLFFSAEAGVGRAFYEEAASGTLLALRIYAEAQAVFVGKFCYTLFMLVALAVFDLALFQVFLGFSLADFFAAMVFLLVVFLGIWGLAAAGVIVSALTVGAGAKSGLFSVLLLPVVLPVFLPALNLTGELFSSLLPSSSLLGAMALYDMILTLGASWLFDFVWQEI